MYEILIYFFGKRPNFFGFCLRRHLGARFGPNGWILNMDAACCLLSRPDELHVTQPRCICKDRINYSHTSQGSAFQMQRTPGTAVALSHRKLLCSFIMHRNGLGLSIHRVQCGCWMCNIVLVCLFCWCYVIHLITISLDSYFFSTQENSALSLGEHAILGSHWFVYVTQYFESELVSCELVIWTQRWKTKYNMFL
jgi:hypothetical protein